jgi:hypothetical protein
MTRTELLEYYLKPTDLTVKELIDRNAFAQIMQFAEAYHLEQIRIGVVSNCDFFCKETLLINGKGKCKNQCNDCSRIENTEYTDTNGHIGSCS